MGKHQLVFFEEIKKIKSDALERYCSEHKPARVAVEFFGNSHDEDQSLAKEYYNAYFKELEGRKEKIRSTAKSHKGQGLMAEVNMQS